MSGGLRELREGKVTRRDTTGGQHDAYAGRVSYEPARPASSSRDRDVVLLTGLTVLIAVLYVVVLIVVVAQ